MPSCQLFAHYQTFKLAIELNTASINKRCYFAKRAQHFSPLVVTYVAFDRGTSAL
jgi:hypothetical protein